MLRLMGINQLFTVPYSPSSNGTVERVNGTLVKLLKKLAVDQPSCWDEYLSAATFAYRISTHRAIQMSPFKALYGRDATLPSSVALQLPMDNSIDLKQAFNQLVIVHQQALDALYRTKESYQKDSESRNPLPSYDTGDEVLVYQSQDSQMSGKLTPSWIGTSYHYF